MAWFPPRASSDTSTGTRARPRTLAVLGIVALVVGSSLTSAGAQGRPLPATLWGVTLDNTADIGSGPLAEEVASLQALPSMPVARIVMDVGTSPADYAPAVTRFIRSRISWPSSVTAPR